MREPNNNEMSLKNSKTTSDFIEWNKLENLYQYLFKHRQYKLSLFVCIGMFTGLRAGDSLSLKWSEIMKDYIEIFEQKTRKHRRIKINSDLRSHITRVYFQLTDTPLKSLRIQNDSEFVFSNKYKTAPISNQYINTQLKRYAKKVRINGLNVSSHSLRKSFGRRVWELNNYSDRSLILLSEIFNHTSIAVTRKYLGIRQAEIFDVYENLN